MTTPYTDDQIIQILLNYMPPWFGSENPNLEAILSGFGSIAANYYSQLLYSKLQTRINSSTDEFVTFFAQSYFGSMIQQCPGETYEAFRARVLNTLIAPRVTREAMYNALLNLTGRAPVIYTAFQNCGFYDEKSYWDDNFYYGGEAPYQAWITVYRPIQPVTDTSMYLDDTAYWDEESYWPTVNEEICVSDDDILKTIEITQLVGTFMHTTILD